MTYSPKSLFLQHALQFFYSLSSRILFIIFSPLNSNSYILAKNIKLRLVWKNCMLQKCMYIFSGKLYIFLSVDQRDVRFPLCRSRLKLNITRIFSSYSFFRYYLISILLKSSAVFIAPWEIFRNEAIIMLTSLIVHF